MSLRHNLLMIPVLLALNSPVMADEDKKDNGDGRKPRISDIQTTYNGNNVTITINGINFLGKKNATPYLMIGNGLFKTPDFNATYTDNQIVVTTTTGKLPSADYLVWVSKDDKFSSEKSDFFDFTVGAVGPQGPAGADGKDGIDGKEGAPGSFPAGTAAGDLQYWDSTKWTMIPAGANPDGVTLTLCGGVPQWGACSSVTTQMLTVSKVGAGSGTVSSDVGDIDCGNNCSASINNNSVVSLTAAPGLNSTFTGWSGACTGSSICVVTMNAAREVTASFVIPDRDRDGFLPPQDCNDTNANINPNATEICDGLDNNCRNGVDEGTNTSTQMCINGRLVSIPFQDTSGNCHAANGSVDINDVPTSTNPCQIGFCSTDGTVSFRPKPDRSLVEGGECQSGVVLLFEP